VRHERAALVATMLLGACTGGGDRIGPERMITLHPRLVTSYILTTIQQVIVDFEPLREYVCDPIKKLVLECQRAERTRTALHHAQTQLTRLLGDAPDPGGLLGSPPLSK
jgi:hypothetical protein